MIKIAGKHKQYISIGTYTVGLSLIFCSCQVYVISLWGIKLLGYSAVWFVWSQACILGWHCLLAYFSSNSYSFKYFFFQKIFQVSNLYNCKYFWKCRDETLKFFKELKCFEAVSQQTSYLQWQHYFLLLQQYLVKLPESHFTGSYAAQNRVILPKFLIKSVCNTGISRSLSHDETKQVG